MLLAHGLKNHPEVENVKSVKRAMGKSDPVYLDGVSYSPEEISAEIIRHCARLLNDQVQKGDSVVYDRVVITVPAYFSIGQKDATRKVGELAGLDVLMLLGEPTAAAINYTVKNGIDNGVYMVYDLGGGTFDVSIIEKIESIPIVLATAGNNYLGGDNFDNMLAHYFIEVLNRDLGYNINLNLSNEEDTRKYKCLLLAAENTKKNLTGFETYSISIFDVFKDNSGVDLVIDDFSREQFENLIREKIVVDSFNECQRALDLFTESGRDVSEIDGILMVGGSSRIPLIKRELEKRFVETGVIKQVVTADPDLAVGYGAGIVAATLPIVVEDENSGLKAEINAPYAFGDVANISGRLLKGGADAVEVSSGAKTWSGSVEGDGSFSIDIDGLADNLDYNFLSGGRIALFVSETAESNNLIAPTPVQNKTIRIEIVDLERQEVVDYPIVERGESLPCTATHDFVINEYSRNQIILPVKEGYRESYRLIINPPSSARIGSKLSVTVDVDVIANVTLSVKLDGKSISGEKVYPDGREIGSERYSTEAQFNEKIANVKYEDRDEYLERQRNIERELREAEANKDKGHYSDAMDKYETLVHEMPDIMASLEETDFDNVEAEIRKLAKSSDAVDMDGVEDDLYFGRRALARGDYKQAQERYDSLCDMRDMLSVRQDARTWFSAILAYVLGILQSVEDTKDSIADTSLRNAIMDEYTNVRNYLNTLDPSRFDSMSDAELNDTTDLILAKTRRLNTLLDRVDIKEVNEKVQLFQGRVSKA